MNAHLPRLDAPVTFEYAVEVITEETRHAVWTDGYYLVCAIGELDAEQVFQASGPAVSREKARPWRRVTPTSTDNFLFVRTGCREVLARTPNQCFEAWGARYLGTRP